jgi:hypothetical protein
MSAIACIIAEILYYYNILSKVVTI